MILKFLKYFFWGLLGFFLQTHDHSLPVDFFVLTLALAFPVLTLGTALFLSFTLALFYGAYSVSSWGAWFFPAAAVLILLRFWKTLGDWPAALRQAWIISLLLAAQWSWGVAWNGWTVGTFRDFSQVGAGTLLLGIGFIPLWQRVSAKIFEALPRPRRPMGHLSFYGRAEKSSRSYRDTRRRPFGLERG